MGCPRRWPGPALALLLLLALNLLMLCLAGEAVGLWWGPVHDSGSRTPATALMCRGLSGSTRGTGPHH